MYCDLRKYLQRHIYFFGGYEEENCEYWVEAAGKSRVILDVGANVGLYSLLAGTANPQATIHAFEPTPEVYDSFLRNIDLNRLRNIIPIQSAVGSITGKAFLHRCTGSDNTNEGMNYVTSIEEKPTELHVDLVSIDDYCQRLSIDYIDLMKMDIEGGEYHALIGAHRLLYTQSIGCIFLELLEWAANRSGHSTIDIQELLLDCGYRLFVIDTSGLVPIIKPRISLGSNVIALYGDPDNHTLGDRIGRSVK